jgi:hypothetical protein
VTTNASDLSSPSTIPLGSAADVVYLLGVTADGDVVQVPAAAVVAAHETPAEEPE